MNNGNVSDNRPLVVGWKEYVDFPEWKLRRVKVKIDTGARTSAVGVIDYNLQQGEDGNLIAHLRLAPFRKRPERVVQVDVPVTRMIVVKNSSGMPEQRPLIEVLMHLGPVSKRIPMTITNRASMRFPMILGR